MRENLLDHRWVLGVFSSSVRLRTSWTCPDVGHWHEAEARRDTSFTCWLTPECIHSHLSSLQLLSQFISPHTGRIYGRHITGEQQDRKRCQNHFLFASSAACFVGTKSSGRLFLFGRFVWKKTKGSFQSYKESSVDGWVLHTETLTACFLSDSTHSASLPPSRFHAGDTQTSTVHAGPEHLWHQTGSIVDQCVIKASPLSWVTSVCLDLQRHTTRKFLYVLS